MPEVHKIQAKANVSGTKSVAAYARVSTGSEALLHSLHSQVSYYRELIQATPGWEYAGVYVDEGISGTSMAQRKDFLRLISDCERGAIDIILVKSISRFARNTADCISTVRKLKALGVEVRFEKEGISSMSSDGELMLTLLASFAEAESDTISGNIKWSIRKKFAEGIPNGNKPPYGYLWDGENYVIVQEEAEVVKRIFAEYLSGLSAYAIHKGLAKSGVIGRSGVPIDESSVKFILTNPAYTGMRLLQKTFTENHKRKRNKGELPRYLVEGVYERIISDEDFQQAQVIFSERASKYDRSKYERTMFSGLLRCGECGTHVSRRTRKGKKIFICNSRERKGKAVCPSLPLYEADLKKVVNELFGDISLIQFKNTIKEIFIFNERIDFILTNGVKRSVKREFTGRRGPFSGRIFCSYCGGVCRRHVERHAGLAFFYCDNQTCEGRAKITEVDLFAAASSAFKEKDGENAFAAHAIKAVVHPDRIVFILKNGDEISCQR